MTPFYIKIADHKFKIIQASNEFLPFLSERFSFAIGQGNSHDLNLRINHGYGEPFEDYDVKIIKKENHIVYLRKDYFIEVDSSFRNATISAHDDLALKHALMNLYSSFILHHNWGLLLHSSCVIDGHKAHIFAGHSGAGKSTAARLSAPRELLSDEATLIKITDRSILIYDSPFRSELETVGHKENAPLSSIQLLYQADFNERTQVKQSDAFMKLMDKVFYWTYKEDEVVKVLDFLKKIVRDVPVYDLHFQKNNTFWELIS
ncbi:hypothetical protein [Rossellomorea sp. NRS-1567]|uniref:hypothetical protein n=1 Tax=Rossellomorea sp. NRS-1567 TaxID=3233901 RepID=UPI003D2AAB69